MTDDNLRQAKVDQLTTQNPDMKGRRVVNAGNAKSLQDYVTLSDLMSYAKKYVEQKINDLGLFLVGYKFNQNSVNTVPKLGPGLNQLQLSSISDDGTKVSTSESIGILNGTTSIDFSVGFSGKVLSNLNTGANSRVLLGQSATAHGTLAWVYNATESLATYDINARTANSLRFLTNNTVRILIDSSGQIGFFGGTPAAQQTLAAYTSNSQGSAYIGIATGIAGSPYASVNDLNTLRTAYQNLLAMCNDLRTKLQTSTIVA